jgi:hypothetical protein
MPIMTKRKHPRSGHSPIALPADDTPLSKALSA